MVAAANGAVRKRISAVLTAAGATRAAYGALRRRPPGGAVLWDRKNYAGRSLQLHAGLATAAGTALTAATAPGLSARARGAAALAVLAAGGCGAYDDLFGIGDPRRGFRAHLSALRRREVTSGAVKLFGIGAAGLAAGALLKPRPADKLLAGVVIAGSAHLVNLLDVRPGRATGAVLALGAPGLLRGGEAGVLSGAAMGAAGAVLGDDLAERTMLGDAGAHALGAALGLAIVAGNGRTGLAAHAAGLVAAAAAGDRVSRAAATI
ncbi:hypothetical protein [Streptomyces gilvosporeus]|uniref:UDP-N-acetylmuramyl pentapeptide phosphotransferase/UDP-N-acetylglucosamine-1-phosphate transferase n=1 Tax=Streptomyces gilvosporeus TaxID=553510 RepID=A0A1V0TPA7_9ACTN|nr:hypothetical protein [Streptomyces gilvosporeus]ARF54650.1 hypothetical protein B1H19_10930 [Streptomyces gilvosporeus]